MKVALIGDVHANLHALEAVLAHARRYPLEAVWNTGDFVGYGAFPDEVVQRLKKEKALSVIGNYDRKTLQVRRKKEEWKKTKAPEKWLSFKWSDEHLSKDSRNYLRALPPEQRFEAAGKKILLVHASPVSMKEHLTPDTPKKRLRKLIPAAEADVIICGHSHLPFVREISGVYFINPGSVGRPDDGDPRASYAILNITVKSIQVQHYRVKYDVEAAAQAIREHGLPETFAQMLLIGRSFDSAAEDTADLAIPARKDKAGGRDAALRSALKLAEKAGYEESHARQSTRLALILFDQLKPLHQLGPEERLWLEIAGMLHDIGLAEGTKGHHKTSLRMILEAELEPFDAREKIIIGSIARYHRKTLPSLKHEHFASLGTKDQDKVMTLSAILRVADALDRTHQDLIKGLTCEVLAEEIRIKCACRGQAEDERLMALEKGDLLKQVFNRDLSVKCRQM
ncbi:MAG TPA: YfcE family phosphodiesterase [bacterium]|nr:YfcE family phosphodiesterase [bacterium]